jgi:hypothetical protein
MSWNPATPLTSPRIRGESIEEDFMNLWHEFLGGYFDGTEHTINDRAVLCPRAEINIQQGREPSQPLKGNLIVGTWIESETPKVYGVTGGRCYELKFEMDFWLRSSGSNKGDGGPQVTIRRLDSILYSLLSNRKLTLPLARKGIRALRASSPSLVTSMVEPMRNVAVRGVIYYTVSDNDTTMLTEDNQQITFDDNQPWEIA